MIILMLHYLRAVWIKLDRNGEIVLRCSTEISSGAYLSAVEGGCNRFEHELTHFSLFIPVPRLFARGPLPCTKEVKNEKHKIVCLRT